MDVDNSFLEQQVRSTAAKRGSNSLNDCDGHGHSFLNKKPKQESDLGFAVPDHGCLAPVPLRAVAPPLAYIDRQEGHVGAGKKNNNEDNLVAAVPAVHCCKQFWKAGDYEGGTVTDSSADHSVGMDHVRVHPKFLHSNATSHKWALGAFAELLDNAVDEVGHGATCVSIDVLNNNKYCSKMLLVEDNGGGMNPDRMRACMSLGYSAKSKIANTIGQYGNGFKTSTMRLGADVIVFSRCRGKDGKSATQSVGLLSYTFLTATGKEDIVVPMWSPFVSEQELLQQFNYLKDQGTRIIIYNLWEEEDGHLELDFSSDAHDIQIRGDHRDVNNVVKAAKYPNCRHFFTYQHSLRSYASILYLELPPSFRIILRGEDVEHHDLVKDMMLEQGISYKPVNVPERAQENKNMAATGKIGFVKDAGNHIDVQGFNVYHKNRLIKRKVLHLLSDYASLKNQDNRTCFLTQNLQSHSNCHILSKLVPFSLFGGCGMLLGSDGRGVIGALEANFVEPAHDKQGFERTSVLSRLEAKLIALQKTYWRKNCHMIGYAVRRQSRNLSSDTEQSPCNKDMHSTLTNQNGQCFTDGNERSLHMSMMQAKVLIIMHSLASRESLLDPIKHKSTHLLTSPSYSKPVIISENGQITTNGNVKTLSNSKAEDRESRICRNENHLLQYERDRSRKFESQLQERTSELEAERKKTELLQKECECLVVMIQEERTRQTERENELRKKIKDGSQAIEDLKERVRQLEGKELLGLQN
ncbi:PROTEIN MICRORCHIDIA 7 [Salix purpurea]|uniref:PROTEIN MICRORCHIDIA 7 n=1 Tax=Salix purpurea TaxID=77065 RepID=A0A9Q0QEH0_SALPP|nr:PROTEIN MICRORCHIDIA 7 [Salix purpurea]